MVITRCDHFTVQNTIVNVSVYTNIPTDVINNIHKNNPRRTPLSLKIDRERIPKAYPSDLCVISDSGGSVVAGKRHRDFAEVILVSK